MPRQPFRSWSQRSKVCREEGGGVTRVWEYRYGFNGQEKSTEIDAGGNVNTAEFWQYDARLGRRWNVDPVVKPLQCPYSTFSGNPIWKVDPNGDDDYFNDRGVFLRKTKTGNLIKVETEKGTFLLSHFKPSANNIPGLVNIINHYRADAGIPDGVKLGISPSANNDPTGGKPASFAYTNTGINVSAKDGISKELDNYNNLVSTLKHEEKHRANGDFAKGVSYKYLDHIAVYDAQIDDKSFNGTSNNFKFAIATNYASYLLGSYNNNEIDENQFNSKVIDFNNKLKDYGTGITKELSGSGYILRVVGKDDSGKVFRSAEDIKPQTNPH